MTSYLDKLKHIDCILKKKSIHSQVQEVQTIVEAVQNKQILLTAPARLGFLPDEFEAILSVIGSSKRQELTTLNHLLNSVRQFLSLKYGIWSVPNVETAGLIKKELNITSALEIMAGNAYWSKALSSVGIKTIATDSLQWAKTSKTGGQLMMAVQNYSAEEAIQKFNKVDLILCSWSPNFGDSDLSAISAWRKYNPKSKMLFIGERNGATNSPTFWEQERFINSSQIKAINSSFRSFDFINERIFEIK